MKSSLHYALATALTLVLSLPLAVRADEHKSDDSKKEDKQSQAEKSEKDKEKKDKADKDETKQLKTFTLKHRKPQEIRQLVMMCEGMHGPRAGLPRTTTGFRGTAQPGQPGQASQEKISVAIDDQKKLVMVRGEEEHLKQVEKLISQLDVPDEELEKIELEKVTLIPLKKESAQRANAALSQLQLNNHHMVSMGEVTLIAIMSGEEDSEEQKKKSEQAKEVISKFEKEDKEKDKSKDDSDKDKNDDES